MARRKKIGLIDLQSAIQEVLDEYGDVVYKKNGELKTFVVKKGEQS